MSILPRTCCLIAMLAGPGIALAQEIPQLPPPVVNPDRCFRQTLTDTFLDVSVTSLVCTDRTIDAAFRVDIYPDGTSYLHLFDFGYAREYDAASAVFRIGSNEAVFLEGYDASLTPYTTTFELSEDLLTQVLAQLGSTDSTSFMYRIDAAPVRQVPLPGYASEMVSEFRHDGLGGVGGP